MTALSSKRVGEQLIPDTTPSDAWGLYWKHFGLKFSSIAAIRGILYNEARGVRR